MQLGSVPSFLNYRAVGQTEHFVIFAPADHAEAAGPAY
jgi:hypothetical protein